MKILDRYIYKEFFPPFLSGTFFFTVMFVLQYLNRLSAMIFEKNVPVDVVLQLLFYTIPFTAAITIPMGTLFGSLFSLGRLSQDSEITVLRSSGVSLYRILKPLFFIGVSITLFLFYFINYVMTETNLRYKSIYINILYSNPGVVMTPRHFTDFSDGSQKISAMKIDEDGWLYHVFLYDTDGQRKLTKLIQADRGRWLNNSFNTSQLSLDLYQGEILQFREGKDANIERVEFEKITINVLNEIQSIDVASEGLREMDFLELKQMIESQEMNNQEVHPTMYVEYHRKFSIPIACLAFVVISIPLAVSSRYKGKGSGLGISLVVIFFYYALMTTAEAMGKKDLVDPRLALHLPNIIFGVIALILMWFQSKE